MATLTTSATAVELPTNRQSRFFNEHSPDVHDPNYIPVLNGADLRVDFSTPSFSGIPSIPTPHKDQLQTSLKRSKSASAPETVARNGNQESPSDRPTVSRNTTTFEIGSSHQPSREDMRTKSPSDDNHTVTSSEPSTTADSAIQEQVYMIPGMPMPVISKPEETQHSHIAHSARSSISSVNRKSIPTSKYNRKPMSCIPDVPPTLARTLQQIEPQDQSLRNSLEPEMISPQSAASRTVPMTPISPFGDSVTQQSIAAARLQASKSTASERRARALHSHPSNISINSKPQSTIDDADDAPLVPRPRSRPSSVRSRNQSLCNSQQLSPAPTTPLPDLPAAATTKRPPTRERERSAYTLTPSTLSQSVPSAPGLRATSEPSAAQQNDHVEMAEFMTTSKTVIFRRFDEVHVRLLLQLQDEISSLEQDLLESERPGSEKIRRVPEKAVIMRELRKALAEYDHLFANWSSMQANKASPETKEKLASWLRNNKPEAMSNSSRKDLAWLQNSNDLSSVSIDEKEPRAEAPQPTRSGPANNGGLFATLFGACYGQRK